MAWRQLPDGSYLDPLTGTLQGVDHQREAAAARLSGFNGVSAPPLDAQRRVSLPSIPPPAQLFAFKTNVGVGELSDTNKRFLIVAGVMGVLAMVVHFSRK